MSASVSLTVFCSGDWGDPGCARRMIIASDAEPDELSTLALVATDGGVLMRAETMDWLRLPEGWTLDGEERFVCPMHSGAGQ